MLLLEYWDRDIGCVWYNRRTGSASQAQTYLPARLLARPIACVGLVEQNAVDQ